MKTQLKIHAMLLLVQCMFAILPSLSKMAFKSFAPEVVLFFRISGSSLLFALLFFLFFYERVSSVKDLFYFALLGIFGVVANQFLFLKGVFYTTAINANIIFTTIPVFTLIIAALFSYEKINSLKVVGIILSLSGVFTLIGVHKLTSSGHSLGNIMIVLNSISYSIFLVIAKPVLKRYKPFTIITWVFLFSTIECIPLCFGALEHADLLQIPGHDYLILLIIIVFSTFLPYTLNTNVLKQVDSSIVAVYIYLQPLIGASFAILLLGEKITLRMGISAVLIIIGVALASIRKQK